MPHQSDCTRNLHEPCELVTAVAGCCERGPDLRGGKRRHLTRRTQQTIPAARQNRDAALFEAGGGLCRNGQRPPRRARPARRQHRLARVALGLFGAAQRRFHVRSGEVSLGRE